MVECAVICAWFVEVLLNRVGSLMHAHFTLLLTDSRSLNQTAAYVPLVLR